MLETLNTGRVGARLSANSSPMTNRPPSRSSVPATPRNCSVRVSARTYCVASTPGPAGRSKMYLLRVDRGHDVTSHKHSTGVFEHIHAYRGRLIAGRRDRIGCPRCRATTCRSPLMIRIHIGHRTGETLATLLDALSRSHVSVDHRRRPAIPANLLRPERGAAGGEPGRPFIATYKASSGRSRCTWAVPTWRSTGSPVPVKPARNVAAEAAPVRLYNGE